MPSKSIDISAAETQLKELESLVEKGTPKTILPAQSRQLHDLVKKHQPDCLVNSRIGNDMGDCRSWATTRFQRSTWSTATRGHQLPAQRRPRLARPHPPSRP